MVNRGNVLVAGIMRINLKRHRFFPVWRCAIEYFTFRTENLTGAYKGKSLFRAMLGTDTICGNGKHPVFYTPRNHGLGTIGKHQVGRMADDIGAFYRQSPCNLGEKPVKADHDANSCRADVIDFLTGRLGANHSFSL